MAARHHVCAVGDLPPGEARVLEADAPIAVFNVAGEFLAIDDRCPHGNASLAEGYLDGDEVVCPLHASVFCLRTGAALCLPARQPVRTYAVVVEDGEVFVEIDQPLAPYTDVPPIGTTSLTGRPCER